jgi:putative (di)nucleoside polyphosphate hydrolase
VSGPAAPRTDLPYRRCVGAMVLDARGHAFVGKRVPKENPEHVPGTFDWQMPQGGIDDGEEPAKAVLRELYEETSMSSVRLLAEAPEWYSYDLPAELRGRAWSGRYRGQTQRWFLFRFTGDEREIDIVAPGGGHHQPEFAAWRWERPENLPGLIVPFKRGVYQSVVEVFRPLWAQPAGKQP